MEIKSEEFLLKRKETKFKINYIKQLIFYILSKCAYPNWVKLYNKSKIKKVVFITVKGLSLKFFTENVKKFKKMPLIFTKAISTEIPYSIFDSTNILRFYARCTNSIPGLEVIQKYRGAKLDKYAVIPLKKYLLSKEELKKNNFPLETPENSTFIRFNNRFIDKNSIKNTKPNLDKDLTNNDNNNSNKLNLSAKCVKELKSFKGVDIGAEDPPPHLIALDCEMVLTEGGRELARCTVIDFFGKLLYDEFCLPKRNIIDYCTKFSGINEECLKNTKKTLEDIQKDLSKFIFKDTIICGHSLENDLYALNIKHDRVIDTSLLFPHNNGPPLKLSLKKLCKLFLKRNIQTSTEGHNSAEDAQATIDLVKLKLDKGPKFGLNSTPSESIFSILERAKLNSVLVAEKRVLETLAENEKKVIQLEYQNKEKREKIIKKAFKKDFNFLWLDISENNEKSEDAEWAGEIDEEISKIYEMCEGNTLMLVLSGDIMTEKMKNISKKLKTLTDKTEYEKTKFHFENLVKEVKEGICFVKLK